MSTIEDDTESESGRTELPHRLNIDPAPSVTLDTFPTWMVERDRWLTWKVEDDGRKVPRSPEANPLNPDRYVKAHDPNNWCSFTAMNRAVGKLKDHRPAFDLPTTGTHPDDPLILLDYDNTRDPDTGELHPIVKDHIERAGSFAQASTSGTGVHILGLAPDGLPEGTEAVDSPLYFADPGEDEDDDGPGPIAPWELIGEDDAAHSKFEGASIEGYVKGRFIAMSGAHLEGTPTDLVDIQELVNEITNEYVTKSSSSPTSNKGPDKSQRELRAIDQTNDMQDVFDALNQIGPRDITLDSKVTNERSGGVKDLDPSWARSESGTRLAQVPDSHPGKAGMHWVYRKGMYGLDAMQVVALEEGIINRESDYPRGRDFWRAVEKLRDRGAHIPWYVDDSESDDEDGEESTEESDDESVVDSTTVLELSRELKFKSTRGGYTYCCPECEHRLEDDHGEACDMAGVDMATIGSAYIDIVDELAENEVTKARLTEDLPWGPVHSACLEYLALDARVVPAGRSI